MHRRPALASLALLLLAGAHLAWAQPTTRRVRGTVQALEGNTLSVVTNAGDPVRIALAPNYTVGAIVPTTLDQIRPGSFIGIVGVGPARQQRAVVVSIFPPGQPVNEAQFAWDSMPDSTMTNAPVASEVAGAEGRVLTVTVKGEPIQVTVPEKAIIQTSEPGTRSLLVPGAKVLVSTQQAADGSLSAARVNVGKDGFTPAN